MFREKEKSENRVTNSGVVGTALGVLGFVAGGPAGMVAGGILVGGGISAITSSESQRADDSQREFDKKEIAKDVGIGATIGAVSVIISATSSVATEAGKEVIKEAVGNTFKEGSQLTSK